MSRQFIETGLGWSWTPARVAASVRDRETNVIVVESAGGLLGFAIMTYGDETAHLTLLAVREGQRRRGLGSILLRWLETTAIEAGIARIRLETRAGNAHGIAFYAARGYRAVRRLTGYYRGIEDALRLEKDLWVPQGARS
jgi:ribosomal-protein-alanine N-acetyltransferase